MWPFSIYLLKTPQLYEAAPLGDMLHFSMVPADVLSLARRSILETCYPHENKESIEHNSDIKGTQMTSWGIRGELLSAAPNDFGGSLLLHILQRS